MGNNILELNENDKYFEDIVPANIKLKRHQLTSLYRCITLENYNIDINNGFFKSNMGILSDKPGSGKSYVILALFKMNDIPLNILDEINVYDGVLSIQHSLKEFINLDLNIIVCSFGLILQWKNYIDYFDDKINLHVVNTTLSLNNFIKNTNKSGILLISSSFYFLVQQFFYEGNYSVKRVVFDEADSTKIQKSRKITARFYWFVTASYHNLLNPFQRISIPVFGREIYSINERSNSGVTQNMFIKNLFVSMIRCIPHVDKYVLSKIIIKNEDQYVHRSFILPDVNHMFIKCVDTVSNIVNYVTTNQNIINSVNAGDLESAISFVSKTNKGDVKHIIDILKDDLEKNLINIILKINYTQELIVDDIQLHEKKLKLLSQTKFDLLDKIQCLKERIESDDLCIICYEKKTNKTITTCCKNSFCFECICKWLHIKKICPFCKVSLNMDKLLVVHNEINESDTNVNQNIFKKIETLELLLKKIVKKTGKKVLIFSEYEKTFMDIIPKLIELNLEYGVLKGNSLKNNIDQYKNGGLDVLLINSKAFGSGLNLENTTDIIIYHYFNYEIQQQVIGRAQRPGRKDNLNVWYLFNEGEIKNNDIQNVSYIEKI